MIVTLAGHVDHGKTSLVRALTGTDTDRLEEEKRRGLTIDLGFAYLDTPDGVLGFVDVPGHHRFIHNMVAGVASHQFGLLVIAADDGPMPQSREHLQILELLGLQRGLIALTKTDRVSPERLSAAEAEIRTLTAGTFLADAEIIPTSVETSDGLEQLERALRRAAGSETAEAAQRGFRLAIDRVFTVTGAGLVVTGTAHSGKVNIDDTLYLFPDQQEVRVRGIRAQNRETNSAGAGDRCALNLSGVDSDRISRGQWLSSEPADGSCEFSVALQVLDDFPREVRHWLPVHIYHASAHATGHIALLQEGRLPAGSQSVVELVTDEPLLVERNDRLIIRDQGLDRTLGGGAVISPVSVTGRRRSDERLQRLAADEAADPFEAFSRHLAIGDVDLKRFRQNWSLDAQEIDRLLDAHDCESIGDFAITRARWQEHQRVLYDTISRKHQADSSLQGLKQSELQGVIPDHLLPAALVALVNSKHLALQTGRYSPESHQADLSHAEQELLDRMTRHLDQPQPPSLGDIAKTLRQPIPQLSRSLTPLVAKKQLVKISDNRYCLPAQVKALAQLALDLGSRGPFTVRDYRDAAGIGRNVAIEMLEYFDSRGFTRRNGNERVISGSLERLSL